MKVYVKTPARLHFGLIDLNGELGRFFGGLGVAVDYPNVVLETEESDTFSVTGENSERAAFFAKQFLKTFHIDSKVNIHVNQVIPEHTGLGSGTQLALAVGSSLAKLFNVNVSVQELSLAMGRMKRTQVGTAVFDQGGFVVDGGKLTKNGAVVTDSFPPLIFHQSFPKDWKFVVAVPDVKKGLAKTEEKSAFANVAPMPAKVVGDVCRLVMMKLLPALVDKDIQRFGEAITRVQVVVGDCFAVVQGGTFSSSEAAETIQFMKTNGAYGVGQSSWGPAVYGLVKGETQANQLQLVVEDFLKSNCGGQVFVTNPNNTGASIKLI